MTAVVHGESDISTVAALFADPARARILTALGDGRSLPASVLAAEAGVAPSTASEHLSRLVEGGLLRVERSGRHRYYGIVDDRVVAAIESLATLAPQPPVRSLRESTRAAALRRARTCYDHLAGRLGVAVTEALIERRALVRTDGRDGNGRCAGDRLAGPVPVHPYAVGPTAPEVLGALGVEFAVLPTSGRPLLRFCVDWSEQRHHLAGALGAALLLRLRERQWVRALPAGRAVELTPAGREQLRTVLGVWFPPDQTR